jgi:hypothetical protein
MGEFAYEIRFGREEADEDFYADVLELIIDTYSSDAATMCLTLATTPDDDGEWTHLGDERLALFQPVQVILGYQEGEGLAGTLGGALGPGGNEGMTPVFTGYVSGCDLRLSSDLGQTSLRVLATDTSVLLALEEKVAVWPGVTDSEVIEQIITRVHQIPAEVEKTATVHQADETVLVQRGSDLQFVRTLARRNGLEFAFETDPASGKIVARCVAPRLDESPEPDLAIRFGEESNLVSLGIAVDGRRPLSVKVTQTDIHSKVPRSAQVTALGLTALGADDLDDLVTDRLETLAAPADATSQLLLLGPPTSESTELEVLAQAARDEAGWFMTAQGEINCDAYGTVLQPRRPVLLKGAGDLYSGAYYVTHVTHTLSGAGNYQQRFEARRNAQGLSCTEQFDGGSPALPLPGV